MGYCGPNTKVPGHEVSSLICDFPSTALHSKFQPTNNNARLSCSYCPSVFILKQGETCHISKGRPHAFRKTEFDILPSEDCHAVQRHDLIKELKKLDPLMKCAPLCISVAYDW